MVDRSSVCVALVTSIGGLSQFTTITELVILIIEKIQSRNKELNFVAQSMNRSIKPVFPLHLILVKQMYTLMFELDLMYYTNNRRQHFG